MAALRLLSLDLSLQATGMAWTCDRHGKHGVGCRTIDTRGWNPKNPHKRLDFILRDIAAATGCRPQLVVIEGAAYSASGSAVDQLAGLRWLAKQWLWSKKFPYVEVAPATLKVWATGDGRSGKRRTTQADGSEREGVFEAITATYGGLCSIRDPDQADAVALLSLACAAYGQPLAPVTNPKQLKATKVPQWPTLDAPVPTGWSR